MKRKLIVFVALFFLIEISAYHVQRYRTIQPTNPAIHFVGRVDSVQRDRVVFDWPGVYFRCLFTGKTLGIKLEGNKDIYYAVFIDGAFTQKVSTPVDGIVWVSKTLKNSQHTLHVYKCTEGFLGISIFKGLLIDEDATILPCRDEPQRRIEFIGNSISCGYGAEGKSKDEKFLPATENNYFSYAAFLSRTFHADYSVIAHSGLGVVRHYGDAQCVSSDAQMPERFERTFDMKDSLQWSFKEWKPDVVCINLGTNDFSTTPFPDKVVFERAYEKLIHTIRLEYGSIPVFCLVGPMIDEPCFAYVKEITENMKLLYGDKQVYFIGIPPSLLNTTDDLGSDWHPSSKGQQKIAAFIEPVIGTVMRWNVQ